MLELLATGGSALAFCSYLRASANVLLQSDGLATPYVLSRHRGRSPMLSAAHYALLRLDAFNEVAQKARITHLDGDSNVFGDAVSRSLWPRFFALCRAISVRPVQVQAPPQLVDLIETLAAAARRVGMCASDLPLTRGPTQSSQRRCSVSVARRRPTKPATRCESTTGSMLP